MGPCGEHGGVTVRTVFGPGGRRLPPKTEITADEAMTLWNPANRRAVADSGAVRWHTNPPAVTEPTERHVVSRGFGKFDVIEGRIINSAPLTKEHAEAMAGIAQEGKVA